MGCQELYLETNKVSFLLSLSLLLPLSLYLPLSLSPSPTPHFAFFLGGLF